MEGTQTDTASAAGMSTGESAFANALAANTAVAGTSAAGVINAGAVPLFALNQQLNVNTAIKIALALKSIDTSLTVDQVQAGTNAALSALYAPAA